MSKRKVLRTEEDFLELILNTYEGREPGLKKMFFTPAEARGVGISAWHSHVRSVIKARRAVENETVPIISVLEHQIRRSLYLTESWINPELDLDPLQSGWELCEDKYSPVLQDKTDQLFTIPIQILKGCSCMKKCSDSRRCGCYKSPHRGGCSPISCKKCSCYNKISDQLVDLHIDDVEMQDAETEGMEEDDDETDEDSDLEEDSDLDQDENDWAESGDNDDDILPVSIGQ